jgi:hypothetical protein
MSPQAWGAIVALVIFALSATFYAGYLTARVSSLESWRNELRADMLQIQASIRRVEIRLGVAED